MLNYLKTCIYAEIIISKVKYFYVIPVLSSILENGRDPEPGVEEKTPLPQNFFVVNM